MTILCVVGARPNFVKIAPLLEAMRGHGGVNPVLVHTGQHSGADMSDAFFRDMAIPRPDFYLQVGSGTQAEVTARIMLAFEPVLTQVQPAVVVVVGDVTSTLACALVAAKCGVPIAHVEAGLRSFDRTMPEEINRVLTDQLSDLLFTTSADAAVNLAREGVDLARVHFVGNVMIDSLRQHLPAAAARAPWRRWQLEPRRYAVLTLHRPVNVDTPERLAALVALIADVQQRIPVVFPVHPRTRRRLSELTGANALGSNLHLVDPLGYLDFIGLLSEAAVVLTDSGGVQEETTALNVPCLTLRVSTERPVTVTEGTNTIVGTDPGRVLAALDATLAAAAQPPRVPDLWDGQTAPRIVAVLRQQLAHAEGARTSR